MDLKQQLVDAGVRLLETGCTVETWGNISCLDRDTNMMYITPSGMDYKTMTADDISLCDLDGNWVSGPRKPSVEAGLHALIYRNRPDVGCVLHTHPTHSTVFSCMGETIPLILDEAAQVLGAPVKTAPYALPGTAELAQNCVDALGQDSNACLLQSHGAVCVANDLKGAFKVATVLEMTAEIYQKIRAIGGTPYTISPEHIATMQDFVKHHYGQRP